MNSSIILNASRGTSFKQTVEEMLSLIPFVNIYEFKILLSIPKAMRERNIKLLNKNEIYASNSYRDARKKSRAHMVYGYWFMMDSKFLILIPGANYN